MHTEATTSPANGDPTWTTGCCPRLGDDRSPWRSDLYIETTDEVPDAEMAQLSGYFLTKVFEGPYRDAREWEQAMQRFTSARGRAPEQLDLGYPQPPQSAG